MKDTTLSASLHLPNEALLFDVNALYACKPSRIIVIDAVCAIHWQTCSWSGCLPNEQDKMVFVGWHIGQNCEPRNEVSSSSSNESVCRTIAPGVACWAMAWSRARWSRSLSQFFAQAIRASRSPRGSIHLAIDGKTLRGTIPLGETEGVHVLAVYLPKPGVVLAQMNVEHKGSEITFAPTLLHQMDVRGGVGSSDTMFDRRAPPSEEYPSAGG